MRVHTQLVMKSVKTVSFCYKPTAQTREVLETFRMMVNHAIQIALEEKVKGRLNLRNRIYREFRQRYEVHSNYPYSVAEVAWSIIKKHNRWHRKPSAERLIMKLDNESYSLNYSIICLPFRMGEPRIFIPLHYGDWQRSFLMDATLKRGSVTMTESTIIIAFSKETTVVEPIMKVGIDLNEKSVVLSDGARYDLSKVGRLHTEYGVRRRSFYARHPVDQRLKRKFCKDSREKVRVRQFLHLVSEKITEGAKAKRQAIIFEELKDIRYVHERGNGESRGRRRRISQWPFGLLQQQIAYKAAWAGVPVEFVDASNTSKECSHCGYLNKGLKMTEREWRCPSCGVTLDRDLNAADNIERRGTIPCLAVVRSGAQGGGSREGAIQR